MSDSPNGTAPRPRAVLHIGTHKTGTTALQYFCAANAPRLQDAGLFYPTDMPEAAAFREGHHYLPWYLADNQERLRGYGYSDAYCAATEDRLASYPGDKTLILSSEGFSLLELEQIRRLRLYLAARDVTVLLYVRRQDEYVQAMYQTDVIHFDHADEIGRLRDPHRLDYWALARRWATVFGHGNVVVRPYETVQLQGGNILEDVQSVLARQGHVLAGPLPKQRLNQGQPWYFVNLIRHLANGTPAETELWAASQRLAWRLYTEGAGEYWFLRPSERVALLAEYAESNAGLAREFLGRSDGQLFRNLSVPMTDEEWKDRFGSQDLLLLQFLSDVERKLGAYQAEVAGLKEQLAQAGNRPASPASRLRFF